MDLSDLPDDPTELMFAMLDETVDRVAQKMAYSRNQTYIPVLLEFLRFQVQSASRSNPLPGPIRFQVQSASRSNRKLSLT